MCRNSLVSEYWDETWTYLVGALSPVNHRRVPHVGILWYQSTGMKLVLSWCFQPSQPSESIMCRNTLVSEYWDETCTYLVVALIPVNHRRVPHVGILWYQITGMKLVLS